MILTDEQAALFAGEPHPTIPVAEYRTLRRALLDLESSSRKQERCLSRIASYDRPLHARVHPPAQGDHRRAVELLAKLNRVWLEREPVAAEALWRDVHTLRAAMRGRWRAA